MLKQLRAAEKSVDTNPTPAQAEAGNYAHGHLRMLGFDVSIENPKDSIRRGTDKSGKDWEVKLKHSYGYIRGTTGADDDHLDCFIGDHPESELIYVIDQHIDGKFDEHKLVFGAVSEEDAREVYLSNYEKGWKGLKHITPLTKAQLRSWVDNGDQTKKLKGQKMDFHKRAGISAPVASNIEGVLNTASTVTDLTNKAAPVVRAVPGLTRTAPLVGSIGKLAAPAAMLSTAADLNAVARDSEGAAKDFNQNWNTSGVAGRALSVVGSPIRTLNAADYNNNNAARVAAANYTPPIQAPQPSFPKPTQTSAPAALVPKPTPMPIPKPAIKRAGMLPGLAMDAVGMVLLPQALHKEEPPPAKGVSTAEQVSRDSDLISGHLTRYTYGGKGAWMAAKEKMPSLAGDVADAIERARARFKKPELPEGEYRSYFTPKGDALYQETLLPLHEQVLGEGIEKETAEPEAGDVPAYEDEHQKIYPVKQWSAKDQEDLEDASKSAAMKCPECGASAKFKKLGDAIKCSECEKTSDIDARFTKKSTFWSLDNSPLSMQEAVKTAFADMRFTEVVKDAKFDEQSMNNLAEALVIDQPKGSTKDFGPDYPIPTMTYPTDYGFFPGYVGEDGDELDFFKGTGNMHGRFRVRRPDVEGGLETKFMVNMTPEEKLSVVSAFHPVIEGEPEEFADQDSFEHALSAHVPSEKNASLLQELKIAKEHSDRGDYKTKAGIIRGLMVSHGDEFDVEPSDEGSHVVGITHRPTGFRMHIPRTEIPPAKLQSEPEQAVLAKVRKHLDKAGLAYHVVVETPGKGGASMHKAIGRDEGHSGSIVHAREAHVAWEKEHGHDPDEDWEKSALHWSKDLTRDIMGGRNYPVSYLTGEIGELGHAIKNLDWENVKEEFGDSAYAAQMLIAQRTGLNLPVLGANAQIKKFYDRIERWKKIFGDQNIPFSVDHLSGGSNYAKPEKIQKAFASAGHQMSPEEAAAISQAETVTDTDEFLTPEIVKHAADQWDKLREELKPDPQMPIIPIPGLRNAMFVPKENFQQDQPIEGLSPDIHALAKAHGLIGYDPRPEFNNESVMRHEMGHSKMWDHDWAHKLRGAGQALSGWSQLLALPLGALLHKRSPLLAPALTSGGTATGFIPTIAGEYHADAAGNTSTADPIIGNFRKTYWNAAGFNTALSAMMATAGRGTAKLVNALMHKVASARPVNVPSRDKLPFRESAEAILRDGDDLVGILAEGHGGKKFLKFPGGGIDEGESIHQGLEREMMEEAGVTGHSLTGHGHSQIVWHPDMEQHKPEKYAQFQGSRRHVFSGWLKSSGKPTSKEGDELTGSMRIPISKAVAHLQDQIAHPENDADGGMLRHRFIQLAAIHELMDSQHEKAAAVAKAIPTTGPEALAYHLSRINLDDLEAQNHALVKSGKVSKRDQAVKILNIVEGMRRNELHPRELMINHVPVIPAAFRPYSLAGSSFIPGNANELYRDLFTNRKVYDEAKRELGPEGEGEAAHNLYNAVRAVYGFGEPVNDKARARGVTGFFEQITGSSPKFGYAQRRLLSKPVDNVGRATITINPDLGLDEIGIPREMAWDIFDTKLHRHLVRKGFSPADAALSLRDRDEHAKRALEDVVPNHPVQYSRAPAWHQFSTLGAMPKLFDGNTIQINPYVTAGLNADFDGDAINVHAPTSEEVLKETRDILMPSKMLFTIRDQDKVMPTIKHESLLSLHNAGARASVKVWNFPSHAEALAAVRKGTVPLHDSIVFPGSEEMEMKTQGLPPVVK